MVLVFSLSTSKTTKKEFDMWDAFGFPKGLENLMHLQFFKHYMIVSSGRVILITPNQHPRVRIIQVVLYVGEHGL
jgi:hypothetical protein